MLINMHEYFTVRVIFALNDACDAQDHLDQNTSHFSFEMKNVEENVQYVEYTSSTSLVNSSTLPIFPDTPTTVYVTKNQIEVIEYITKCTG